jgi:hypothetical protein
MTAVQWTLYIISLHIRVKMVQIIFDRPIGSLRKTKRTQSDMAIERQTNMKKNSVRLFSIDQSKALSWRPARTDSKRVFLVLRSGSPGETLNPSRDRAWAALLRRFDS